MSASWASRALVLAIASLGLASAATGAPRAARPDTTHAVAGVRVSDEGIHIQGGVATDSLTSGSGRMNATLDVGGQRVRIRGNVVESRSGDQNVRVVGPVVVVDDEGDNLVRVFADAEVPAGERVEGNVVAVFGSVTVKGQIAGDAVAVFGTLRLEPGSLVDGDAVAVGGSLVRAPSATVSGQSIAIEPGFAGRLSPGAWPAASAFHLVLLILFVVPLVLGALWFPIAPDRMLRIATTIARRPFVAMLGGLVAGPLTFLLGLLLLITVVGIPIAILLPILFGLVGWAGQTAALQVVGCRLTRRPLAGSGPVGPYFAGALFVSVLMGLAFAGLLLPGAFKPAGFFLLLIAGLVNVGLGLMGTGAVLLSRFGSNPKGLSRRTGLDGGTGAEVPVAHPSGSSG